MYNAQWYGDAQATNRAKDDFLATLSHELRTPMTSILGWARLLQMGAIDPATQHDAVRAIEKSSMVQAQLIDDILDVSRITLGKLHLDIDNIDLIDVLRGANDSVRPAATPKDNRLPNTLPTHGKPLPGDPTRPHHARATYRRAAAGPAAAHGRRRHHASRHLVGRAGRRDLRFDRAEPHWSTRFRPPRPSSSGGMQPLFFTRMPD